MVVNITYIFDGDNAGAGGRGDGGGGGGWTHGDCFLELWGLRNVSMCVCVCRLVTMCKEGPMIRWGILAVEMGGQGGAYILQRA